jgi:hypothetical protein
MTLVSLSGTELVNIDVVSMCKMDKPAPFLICTCSDPLHGRA